MRVLLFWGDATAAIAERLESEAQIGVVLDDLTFGPVSDWADPLAFARQRQTFWTTLHAKRSWEAIGPGTGWAMLYRLNPERDAPDRLTACDLVTLTHQAEEVVVWSEVSVQGLVTYTYLVTALEALGFDGKLGLRLYRRETFDALERDWQSLTPVALDRLGRVIDLAHEDRLEASALWQARVALPIPPDPVLLTGVAATWRKAFEMLAGRFPDRDTGLTRVQQVALMHTQTNWRKMALVVARSLGWYAKSMDHVGDLILQDALERMALMPQPLIEIKGIRPDMGWREVRLTETGAAVKARLMSKGTDPE